MSDRLKISVVIPAYNSARNIGRTLESVLGQTRLPDEIIVVDDGSQDNTAEIVQTFAGKVRLLSQANAGASAARNAGINASTGQWIAFLDSDDIWLENHLQTQEQILLRNPNLVWSAANHINCLESVNKRFPYANIEKCNALLAGKDYHESYFDAFRLQATGCTNTVVIRKDVLLECGLFRTEQKIANDLDMWFRIAHRYPMIGYSPIPASVYYLEVAGSISKRLCTIEEFTDLLNRNLEYAKEAGNLPNFQRHKGWQVPARIRASMFDDRCCDARAFARDFKEYIPAKKYYVIMVLTIMPRLTMHVLRAISKVVRKTGLRKKAIRPPKRLND